MQFCKRPPRYSRAAFAGGQHLVIATAADGQQLLMGNIECRSRPKYLARKIGINIPVPQKASAGEKKGSFFLLNPFHEPEIKLLDSLSGISFQLTQAPFQQALLAFVLRGFESLCNVRSGGAGGTAHVA